MPTILRTYPLRIQWGLFTEWKYDLNLFSGTVFEWPTEELLSVTDNRTRELEKSGKNPKIHNVLSKDDVAKVYK